MWTDLMFYLATAAAAADQERPALSMSLIAVYVIGFIAATTLGSVAWYNSRRPPGWEDKERPAIVPEVDSEEPQI
jgi:hypothetical protein